jgi:transcriptional regulator with XRE-family HTH domain
MTKKSISTFEMHMHNPKRKKQFDQQYREFVLSELLLALMEEDEISVRELAKEAGVSPTIVQQIRSGAKGNLTLSTLISILEALGYTTTLEIEKKKGKQNSPRRFPLSSSRPTKRSPISRARRPKRPLLA